MPSAIPVVAHPSSSCRSTLTLQVVQLFDSWAHHLSPEQFREFSLPYAQRVIDGVRARHPATPLIFHANGGALSLYFCLFHMEALWRQRCCVMQLACYQRRGAPASASAGATIC